MNTADEDRFDHEASGRWLIDVAHGYKRRDVEARYPLLNWRRRYVCKADCVRAIANRPELQPAYEIGIGL